MRDDNRCQIRLTHSSIKDNVTFYHLELTLDSQCYQVSYRYSKLRNIALILPQVILLLFRHQSSFQPLNTSENSSPPSLATKSSWTKDLTNWQTTSSNSASVLSSTTVSASSEWQKTPKGFHRKLTLKTYLPRLPEFRARSCFPEQTVEQPILSSVER